MSTTTRGKRRKPSKRKPTAIVNAECELISIDRLEPDPELSRGSIDDRAIKQLAKSLASHGQRTPMIVRRVAGSDKFKIVCGERRWRAAKLTTRVRALSCWVIDDPDEGEILFHYLDDNISREDLAPLELGERLKRLMETRNWSVPKLAAELGVVESRVRRPLALLRLPIDVQDMVRRGELPLSHALEIAKAPSDKQLMIARDVVFDRLRLDETKDMVSDYRTAAGDRPRYQRWPLRFPFPEDRAVVLLLHPEDTKAEMRRLLLEVVLLIENIGISS
jgi:ParB family chromosome partitioning protein